MSSFHVPALPRNPVTVRPSIGADPSGRAGTVLTAQQRVVAERQVLTHIAGGSDRLRRADAASRHFVTQSAPTFTSCDQNQTLLV